MANTTPIDRSKYKIEETKNPRGRPSKYTPEIASEIFTRLSFGRSVREVCEDDDMPSLQTFYTWLSKYPEFLEQYYQAASFRVVAHSEEQIDLGKRVLAGEITPQAYNAYVSYMSWLAERMSPRKYGRKEAVDVNANISANVQTVQLSPKEAAEQLIEAADE